MLLVVVGGVDFWILELIPKNNRKRIQITYHNQQKQMKEFMIKVVMYVAKEHKRKIELLSNIHVWIEISNNLKFISTKGSWFQDLVQI